MQLKARGRLGCGSGAAAVDVKVQFRHIATMLTELNCENKKNFVYDQTGGGVPLPRLVHDSWSEV